MKASQKILSLVAGMFALGGTALHAEPIHPDEVVYEDWLVTEALSGEPGDAERGYEVYTSRSQGNCIACHSITALLEDVQWHGTVGPSLDGVGARWEEADLRGIVANAKNLYPDTIMPAFYKSSGFIRPGQRFTMQPAEEPLEPILSAQQIEDVVAYLLTLTEYPE